MAIVSKGVKKAEEIVPYQCYACLKYDGTFGPEKDQHTHTCETCKKLPAGDQGPIRKHEEEYFENEGKYGEETLGCRNCGLERDECKCPDNRVRLVGPPQVQGEILLGDLLTPDLREEMREAERVIEERERRVVEVRPNPFRVDPNLFNAQPQQGVHYDYGVDWGEVQLAPMEPGELEKNLKSMANYIKPEPIRRRRSLREASQNLDKVLAQYKDLK